MKRLLSIILVLFLTMQTFAPFHLAVLAENVEASSSDPESTTESGIGDSVEGGMEGGAQGSTEDGTGDGADGGDVEGGTGNGNEGGDAENGTGNGSEGGDAEDGTGNGSEDETEDEIIEDVFVPMELSPFGLELIKSFEGFSSKAEWDYNQWSIGYGCKCEEDEYPNGITEYEATELMKKAMPAYVNAVNKFMDTYDVRLNQNQFDALVSFSYNCGKYVWNMNENSFTLKKLLIEGNWNEKDITNAFLMWVKAGGSVLQGLVRRRTREAALFNSDINIQDPSVKYYYVTVKNDQLNIRSKPTSNSSSVGSIKNTIIIPITEFSEDGKWGYTPYGAYFGWVSTDYIEPLDEVLTLDENMRDAYGIKYTLGTDYKTIIAGVPGGANGNALYGGLGDGNVYLNRYIRVGDYVYCLTQIADKAFYGNTKLKTIYIPLSVEKIGKNSFTNSGLTTVYCTTDSYAQSYASSKGYISMEYECRDGHTYSASSWKVLVQASCTEDGLEGKCCDVCGYISETKLIGTAYGHDYEEGVMKTVSTLSCTTDHVEGIVCRNCGHAKDTRVIEKATGHSAGDWETVSKASCTSDGVSVKKCTHCAEIIETKITPSYHVYDANKWVTVVEPTCTEAGASAVLCDICKIHIKNKVIEPHGHSYGDWYVSKKPTYLKTGIERRDCSICQSYETKSIAKLKSEIVSDTLKLNSKTKRVEGIAPGTKVSDILAQIENTQGVKIIDKNSKGVSGDKYVGSGMQLILYEGSKRLLTYTFIINGDADGNGLTTDWDCILLGRHLAGWDVDVYLEALDFDGNGKVNDWDEILFSRYLAGWNVKIDG